MLAFTAHYSESLRAADRLVVDAEEAGIDFALRTYPGRGSAIVAFQVVSAQAWWSSVRWLSGFFEQRIRIAR